MSTIDLSTKQESGKKSEWYCRQINSRHSWAVKETLITFDGDQLSWKLIKPLKSAQKVWSGRTKKKDPIFLTFHSKNKKKDFPFFLNSGRSENKSVGILFLCVETLLYFLRWFQWFGMFSKRKSQSKVIRVSFFKKKIRKERCPS